jgi:hypothetical protein
VQGHLSDVTVAVDDANVATVEIHRPPANYFDTALMSARANSAAIIP